MRKNNPVLPQNVIEQITLWENERNRMVTNEASMFQEFESIDEFKALKQFCVEHGVFLWATPDTSPKRVICTNPDGRAVVQKFQKLKEERLRVAQHLNRSKQ